MSVSDGKGISVNGTVTITDHHRDILGRNAGRQYPYSILKISRNVHMTDAIYFVYRHIAVSRICPSRSVVTKSFVLHNLWFRSVQRKAIRVETGTCDVNRPVRKQKNEEMEHIRAGMA